MDNKGECLLKKYCCDEHVDIGIDEIVDELEIYPNLELLTESEKLSTTCTYCEKKPIYKVSNE
ncbi:CxxH/CxxC protein [Fictibacillus terranigra]|uniref:CxxH/CxxC protein n=1 Tax=Fictibacillus terranigra TaxID=3058424 RepID=A0ABT8E0M6_9BACL|nr:CxxH/CxxC protein [Fictibacillus sp. CENA-BCM004]MDN4071455.1 CxxH/CxxC protein [Fictibacillus sp. CENA-BCM004]